MNWFLLVFAGAVVVLLVSGLLHTKRATKEKRFQKELDAFLVTAERAVLAEYERGYEDETTGDKQQPPSPVFPAQGSPPEQMLAYGLSGAYFWGWEDAEVGRPNRVKAWRDAGGTLDGPLPRLRD